MNEMTAFANELGKVAADSKKKKSRELYEGEFKNVAKNILLNHAPGFGLGMAIGWAAGKKILPKVAPAVAGNPAIELGVTIGAGLLGAHVSKKIKSLAFDDPKKRNSK